MMKNRISALAFACILLAALVLSSCGEKDRPKTFTISSTDYELVNYPSDWNSTYSAYFFVRAYWSEDSIGIDDIKSVVLTANDGYYWNFTIGADLVNASSKYLDMRGWYGHSSNTNNVNRLPLGAWTVKVTLVDGNTATETVDIKEPGSTAIVSGTKYAVTEDYGTPPADYTSFLKRPGALSGTKDTSSIDLSFTLSDSRIARCGLWFYDASGNYIGFNKTWMRDLKDGASTPTNASWVKAFATDGTASNCSLTSSDISMTDTSKTISDIAGFRVVAMDGLQFLPTELGPYYHEAVSTEYKF
jgi:hypothetical protein